MARNDELEGILRIVDSVAQGVGRLVMLSGEPGVGKTRLAQEVTLACRNRGFLVATGRCYESHGAMPFYPFFEALTSAYKAASPAVRFKVEDRWPVLGRLLPNQGVNPPATSSEGAEDQQKLFWAVTGFLQEIANEQPVALLVDDLHWADTSTLQLLEHLVRQTRGNGVLLLGTYRDVEVGRQHPLESALLDFRRERLIEEVRVRRLEQEGTAALISAAVGEESISPEFAGLVHRRSEGNAFFVEEVLRALIERGDVYRDNGRWERREIEEIEVPESIRAVIGQRLGRLQGESQEILREASVLGQTFDFEVLRGINDRSEKDVEAALEEASRAGLVREASGDKYAFNHALTQQSLYAELSVRRKRRLHIAAGEVMERLLEKHQQRPSAELAWHFIQGDDPERALLYASKAGDEAEEIPAHGEAERHYRTAVELARELSDDWREVQALEKLGNVLGSIAQYDEALDALERSAKYYQQAGDTASECRVAEGIGTFNRGRGTLEQGIERVKEILTRVEHKADKKGVAILHATLEFLFFAVGRYADELSAAEHASVLA